MADFLSWTREMLKIRTSYPLIYFPRKYDDTIGVDLY